MSDETLNLSEQEIKTALKYMWAAAEIYFQEKGFERPQEDDDAARNSEAYRQLKNLRDGVHKHDK